MNANPFNLRVIEEFRANGGAVGGEFAGTPLLLLTTRGARSGGLRTTPLVYLPDADGRPHVFALNGGAPVAPAWYHNLRAHPESLRVELGGDAFPARAVEVTDPAEYEELWRRQTAAEPKFAAFRERAGRAIPVVRLERRG